MPDDEPVDEQEEAPPVDLAGPTGPSAPVEPAPTREEVSQPPESAGPSEPQPMTRGDAGSTEYVKKQQTQPTRATAETAVGPTSKPASMDLEETEFKKVDVVSMSDPKPQSREAALASYNSNSRDELREAATKIGEARPYATESAHKIMQDIGFIPKDQPVSRPHVGPASSPAASTREPMAATRGTPDSTPYKPPPSIRTPGPGWEGTKISQLPSRDRAVAGQPAKPAPQSAPARTTASDSRPYKPPPSIRTPGPGWEGTKITQLPRPPVGQAPALPSGGPPASAELAAAQTSGAAPVSMADTGSPAVHAPAAGVAKPVHRDAVSMGTHGARAPITHAPKPMTRGTPSAAPSQAASAGMNPVDMQSPGASVLERPKLGGAGGKAPSVGMPGTSESVLQTGRASKLTGKAELVLNGFPVGELNLDLRSS